MAHSSYRLSGYSRMVVFLLVILLIGVIWYYGMHCPTRLETVQAHALQFREYVGAHYLMSVVLYILAYIAIAVAGLPLAALSTVVAGYLFGAFPAALYTVIGATIGGAAAFLMVRYIIGGLIQDRYAARLTSFNSWVVKRGWLFLLYVHLVPFIPFFMVNLLAGLTRVPLLTFMWTTAVGVFPPALIFASAGKYLVELRSLHELWSWQMIGIFSLLIALAFAPLVIVRIVRYRDRN